MALTTAALISDETCKKNYNTFCASCCLWPLNRCGRTLDLIIVARASIDIVAAVRHIRSRYFREPLRLVKPIMITLMFERMNPLGTVCAIILCSVPLETELVNRDFGLRCNTYIFYNNLRYRLPGWKRIFDMICGILGILISMVHSEVSVALF